MEKLVCLVGPSIRARFVRPRLRCDTFEGRLASHSSLILFGSKLRQRFLLDSVPCHGATNKSAYKKRWRLLPLGTTNKSPEVEEDANAFDQIK